MHSESFKTEKQMLDIYIQWCFLLAVMVVGDESSWLRMTN